MINLEVVVVSSTEVALSEEVPRLEQEFDNLYETLCAETLGWHKPELGRQTRAALSVMLNAVRQELSALWRQYTTAPQVGQIAQQLRDRLTTYIEKARRENHLFVSAQCSLRQNLTAIAQRLRAETPTTRRSFSIIRKKAETQGAPSAIDSWVEVLPSKEEVAEKTRGLWSEPTLQDRLVTSGSGAGMGAGSLATIAKLAPRFLLPIRVALTIGTVVGAAAGAIAPACADLGLIVRSVFDEMSLKREALLSQGTETVIYVMPKRDRNAMSHMPGTHDAIRKVARNKRLVVARIDDPDQLTQLIKGQRDISILWIRLHGNHQGIAFDRNGPLYPSMPAWEWAQEHFAPEAQIILQSCWAGAISSNENHVDVLSRHLREGISITAPKTVISRHNVQVEGEEVSFKVEGKDVTTRYLSKKPTL